MNIMPLVFTVLTVAFGSAVFELEVGLLAGLVVGLIALQRQIDGKIVGLQHEITKLSERLAGAPQEQQLPELDTNEQDSVTGAPESHAIQSTDIPAKPDKSLPAEVPVDVDETAPSFGKPASPIDNEPDNAFGMLLARTKQTIWSYFTDGNVFVRVGLLILFFGVAFLLKYAAENSRIPLELRFLGAAAGGFALLVAGWRLRNKKEIYALLLQGGGIGIIYITIFVSYRIADLIPSTLTFILLVAFAVFTAALAVLQNSRTLAIYAVIGGFLAPFLASSGSDNYVGLFSYYAVLNAAILIIAWFKSWRLLNLIGFVFTFAVYALWFVFAYKTHMLIPAMGFLLLFFLMYSVIGVLYALKQTYRLKGLIDGTLVFGTPVIASSLLMAMVRHLEYGIALAAVGIGFYYVLLARLLWNRSGDLLRLLAEAMLAIGVVFATLAIPYSLDGHWSSAAWALEAAGILWISIRQRRRYAQLFAIVLQFGAGALFLLRNVDELGDIAWINPAFLGGFFIALGAFISARLLYKLDSTAHIRLLHTVFFVWAMCWWLGSVLVQIDEYVSNQISAWLLLFSVTAGILVFLDRVKGWNWTPASVSSALLLPVLIVISLQSINDYQHVLILPDALIWVLALALNYWTIVRLENCGWPQWISVLLHAGFVVFVACVLSIDLTWYFEDSLPGVGSGFIALLAIIPLLFMYAARTARFPAISRFGLPLQLGIIASLGLILAAWSIIVNISNTADPAPLPYLPLINPLDLAHIVFFISVVRALTILEPPWSNFRNHVLVLLGGLIFIWLTAVLLRSMHHYADIPFNLITMFRDTKIQTAISILWTVIGMLAMLLASRKIIRAVWIIGAVLIAVVLFKMFFIDLDASGTVERIVSFLVVGGLLVAMGYFSPIPQKRAADDRDTESTIHES